MSIGNISNMQNYFALALTQSLVSSFSSSQPTSIMQAQTYQPNLAQNNSSMNMFGALQSMLSLFSMFMPTQNNSSNNIFNFLLNNSAENNDTSADDNATSDNVTNVSSNVNNLLVNVNASSQPDAKQFAIDVQNTTEFLKLDDDTDDVITREELATYMGIDVAQLDREANSLPQDFLGANGLNDPLLNKGNTMLDELYAEIDNSHDGKIDKQEFINRVDSDKNGRIEEAEVENFKKEMQLEGGKISNGRFIGFLEKLLGEDGAKNMLADNNISHDERNTLLSKKGYSRITASGNELVGVYSKNKVTRQKAFEMDTAIRQFNSTMENIEE